MNPTCARVVRVGFSEGTRIKLSDRSLSDLFSVDYYPLTRYKSGERVPVIPSDQQAASRVAGFSPVWTNPDKKRIGVRYSLTRRNGRDIEVVQLAASKQSYKPKNG